MDDDEDEWDDDVLANIDKMVAQHQIKQAVGASVSAASGRIPPFLMLLPGG